VTPKETLSPKLRTFDAASNVVCMTNTQTPVISFEIGATYSTRRISDHTMSVDATITARTAKFVTFDDKYGCSKRVGVHTFRGVEQIMPEGSHSMCPIIGADQRVA